MFEIKKDIDHINWNRNLQKCKNPNVFATWEWGEYKNRSWSVERITFLNKGHFIGQMQILTKNIGPFEIGWCASGINVVKSEDIAEIIDTIKGDLNFKKRLWRINFFDPAGSLEEYYIDSCKKLKKVKTKINSGYTIRFRLNEYDNLPSTYTSNNRYYLKKSKENNLSFDLIDFNSKSFVEIHNSMADLKDLGHLKINDEEMSILGKCFGSYLKMALVKNSEGEICSICSIIKFERMAYYFLAGSNELGRKNSSSFLMVSELISRLKDDKIMEFDFGGITPFKDSALGVNRFKLGFNGNIVKYVGEFDLSDNKLLIWIFNILLKFKTFN